MEQNKAMDVLKEILRFPPALGQVNYESSRPVIVTVDTCSIAIGWIVEHDDASKNWFSIRFEARILTKH